MDEVEVQGILQSSIVGSETDTEATGILILHVSKTF